MIKKFLRLFLIPFVFAFPISGYLLYQSNKLPDKGDITFFLTGKKKSYIENLQEQAISGDTNAMIRLGNNHKHGYNGLKPNNVEAIKWYKKAINHGDLDAMWILARMYENGEGVDQDNKKAFNLLSDCAQQSNISCMGHLGRMYHDGIGTETDYKKAFEWWLKTALKGNADAQFRIGYFYDIGKKGVVEKNLEQARIWYEKSAAQNNSEAQRFLGYIYLDREGELATNLLKAGELFSTSAQNGNSSSQKIIDSNSRKCHETRYGSKINYNMKSCFLAAYSGDPLAMHAVGLSYYDGRADQEINYPKAFKWIEGSAKAGLSSAQMFLGMFYEMGIGIKPNKIEAYAWIGLGITQNDGDPQTLAKAKQTHAIIFSEMSDPERKKAIEKLKLYSHKYTRK
jgi:TPR repeat protein